MTSSDSYADKTRECLELSKKSMDSTHQLENLARCWARLQQFAQKQVARDMSGTTPILP